MRIIFTDLFKKEYRDKFQITEDQVQQVITSPDEQQVANFNDLSLRFFIKRILEPQGEHYLLVCTRLEGSNLLVDLAFRILPELVEEVKTLDPIILLQQLALKFGLTIRIGQQLNKFIFRESIPIKSFIEPAKIVEILNPKDHPFIQSMLIKIEQQGDMKIANCALAFCIDLDSYLPWLMGEKSVNDVFIDIAPQIRGHVTPRDLIEANGTFTFWIDSSQFGEKTGYFFKVVSPNYYLEAGFTKTNFYITRNDKKLEIPLEPYKQSGYVNCYAMWQPTELSLLILDKSYDKAVSSGADAIDEIEKRKKILRTPPTLPPNSLIAWARRKAIAPMIIYNSLSHFYQEVAFALQSIPDKIATVGMYNAFWDIAYEGSRIVSRKPKREPDILPIVHSLLFDIATAKNFQVYPEHQIGRGLLDFLISGHLKTGEIANVCVEFKHAHSPDLEDGLIKQLPAYMRAKGCDFGLYCVMFFKGPYFTEPRKHDIRNIDLFLSGLASSAGLSNIRILIFDLSRPKPPSRL
ncbi:MAG: hypothetical protein J7K33_05560 [Candidatus Marinimicrobia bacterium]|nr:hypothetical protein [Candidatus Neomarinimicrobiota bacterium]